MSISWNYQDDVHTELNSETRMANEYEPGGVVLIRSRPFTAQENLDADAKALQEAQALNRSAIHTNLAQDLTAMQAILDQTNANLRDDPSQEIKDMARTLRRLTKMALGDFSTIE